jgi:hypothetical protein
MEFDDETIRDVWMFANIEHYSTARMMSDNGLIGPLLGAHGTKLAPAEKQ